MKSKTYLGTGVRTYLEAKVEFNCSSQSGIVVVSTISFLNLFLSQEIIYIETDFERKVRKTGGRRGMCFALL